MLAAMARSGSLDQAKALLSHVRQTFEADLAAALDAIITVDEDLAALR